MVVQHVPGDTVACPGAAFPQRLGVSVLQDGVYIS